MQRPVSTVVLGVLNLAFAAIGAIGFFMTLPMLLSRDAQRNPILKLIETHPGYALFLNVSMVVGAAALVVLVLAGVGLLLLKPWGRHCSIVYGIYAIVAGIVGLVVNCSVMLPELSRAANLPPGPPRAVWIAGLVSIIAGTGLGLIYPTVLLCFMFTRTVKNACRSPYQAESADEPRQTAS